MDRKYENGRISSYKIEVYSDFHVGRNKTVQRVEIRPTIRQRVDDLKCL